MSKNAGTPALWDGSTYAPSAGHHRVADDWFLARHPPMPGETVVDAGCGTGEFTRRLAELVRDGRVIGVEPDPSMLDQAQATARDNLEFRQGRLEALDAVCEPDSADLVVSRAVFNWIPLADYARCYTAIRKVLKPGGWLHAESGGAGNVRHVIDLLDDIARHVGLGRATVTLPDAATAMELVDRVGFVIPEEGVSTVAQRRVFDRDSLRGFLHAQAAMAYVSNKASDAVKAFRAGIDERFDELRRGDGTYDQIFVRLHVLCQRPATP